MSLPLANDFHTALEFSRLGGPVVGVPAFICAILAALGSGVGKQIDNAQKAFLGGAAVSCILVALGQQS